MACLDCQKKNKNIFEQAVSIAKGFTNLAFETEEIRAIAEPRLAICYSCPFHVELIKIGNKIVNKCTKCTCVIEAKVTVASEKCEENKW